MADGPWTKYQKAAPAAAPWAKYGAPQAAAAAAKADAVAASAQAVITYTNGAWPARPAGVSRVTWWDPTGSAPQPAGFVPATDLWERATTIAATGGPTEKLSPEAASLDGGWYPQGGTPAGGLAGGKLTLSSGGQKWGAGPVPVKAGRKYTFTATPAAGSTGRITLESVIAGASPRYPYTWAEDAGRQTLEFTAAQGDTEFSPYITWQEGVAVIESTSLIEHAPEPTAGGGAEIDTTSAIAIIDSL